MPSELLILRIAFPWLHNNDLPLLTATVLELTPSPSLAGIEGDVITFTCGPPENDPITLLVNGLADTTVAFDDVTGNRTYSLGPLDRNMEGNTYQCTSGTRMSEITTLSVYCKWVWLTVVIVM